MTGTSELTPWELRYPNPANANQIWCGRGRKPRWFEKAMAAGRTPEDLLI
ncbi:H-NS family nucleoid-associated regulatory protein (plasmid) [Cereibacter azotoformans]|nr:H-NS histone family protein [Cereibacter sediminicola]